MQHERKLVKVAIFSRFLLIATQYVFNQIIPDHNAGVFLSPAANSEENFLDKIIHHVLGGFVRWDAQYFMHLAQFGYTYENTLAFFPLYPMVVKVISSSFLVVFPIVTLNSMLLLIFTVFNGVFFVLSALSLFHLTSVVFNCKSVAFRTGVLFCFNPASIFFTAPYTECFFSYLTFQTMLKCVILYRKHSQEKSLSYFSNGVFQVVFSVCLSAIVRSNGVLNVGFVVYTLACLFLEEFQQKVSFRLRVLSAVNFFASTLILVAVSLLPFVFYQVFCYQKFCQSFASDLDANVVDYAEIHRLVMPGEFLKHNQTWCYNKLPLAYSYVQKHYWDVGFLNYFKLRQIPNFALAFPALFIVIYHCLRFLQKNLPQNVRGVFTLNQLHVRFKGESIFHPKLFVFVVHALFLAVFCLFFVHVQVSTRMIASATPLFYWFCQHYLRKSNFSGSVFGGFFRYEEVSFEEKFVKFYFLSYFFVGTIVFCNFLPWT